MHIRETEILNEYGRSLHIAQCYENSGNGHRDLQNPVNGPYSYIIGFRLLP